MSKWKIIFFIALTNSLFNKIRLNDYQRNLFNNLLQKSKNYIATNVEYQFRLKIFLKIYEQIKRFNVLHNDVQLGFNQFSLLTYFEIEKFLSTKRYQLKNQIQNETKLKQQKYQNILNTLRGQQKKRTFKITNNKQQFQYYWENKILQFSDKLQRDYQELYQVEINECQISSNLEVFNFCIKESQETFKLWLDSYEQQNKDIQISMKKDFKNKKNKNLTKTDYNKMEKLSEDLFQKNKNIIQKSIDNFSKSAKYLYQQNQQDNQNQDQTDQQQQDAQNDTQQKQDDQNNIGQTQNDNKDNSDKQDQNINNNPTQENQNDNKDNNQINNSTEQSTEEKIQNNTDKEEEKNNNTPTIIDIIQQITDSNKDDQKDNSNDNQPIVSPTQSNSDNKKNNKDYFPKDQKIKPNKNPFKKFSLYYKLYEQKKVQKDWQQEGKTTPIRNQGVCGSCWSFSAIGVIESQILIDNKKERILSVQQPLNCGLKNLEPAVDPCDGGLGFMAIMSIQETGVQLEKELPYQEKQTQCNSLKQNDTRQDVKTLHFLNNSSNMEEFLLALYERPLGVAFHVGKDFVKYDKGIINCFDRQFYELGNSNNNHEVLAVGYFIDIKNPEKSYIKFKNQWDNSWGENGHFRLRLFNQINDNGKMKIIDENNITEQQQNDYAKNGPCGLINSNQDTFWVTLKYQLILFNVFILLQKFISIFYLIQQCNNKLINTLGFKI